MTRQKASLNKSNYHFKIKVKNEDDIIEDKYYFTKADIRNDYNICQATIFNCIKKNRPIIKYPNIVSIEKVNIPAYKSVLIGLNEI